MINYFINFSTTPKNPAENKIFRVFGKGNRVYLTNPELRFCAGSNAACGVSEIYDGENFWQCSWLEINFVNFCPSAILQKQFIIIITITKVHNRTRLLHFAVITFNFEGSRQINLMFLTHFGPVFRFYFP